MRFLVIGRSINYGGPYDLSDSAAVSESMVLPSIQMLKDWEDNKQVVGGLFAAQRASVLILEAASAEELSQTLQTLPFWMQNTWEVIPLQSFMSGIEDTKRYIERVKKMAETLQAENASPMPAGTETEVLPK